MKYVEQIEEIEYFSPSRYNDMLYILSWCQKQRLYWESESKRNGFNY